MCVLNLLMYKWENQISDTGTVPELRTILYNCLLCSEPSLCSPQWHHLAYVESASCILSWLTRGRVGKKSLWSQKSGASVGILSSGERFIRAHVSSVLQNTAVLSAAIIITLVGMILHIHFVKVDHESLLVIGSLGIQVSASYASGRETTEFIEMNKIKDIVINEAIYMVRPLLRCYSHAGLLSGIKSFM